MSMSCWSLMYKLVDSTKCRLQTDCRPLFSGLESNRTISGFIAQLVRASHRYREVTCSVLIFLFSGFLRNCINCVYNCEDHSSFDFIAAVFIYDFFHMHLSIGLLLSRSICMVKTMFCTDSILQSSFCTYVIYWDTHCVT